MARSLRFGFRTSDSVLLAIAFLSHFFGLVVGDCCADDLSKPNVVLVMTDDQGWGDFGFHGNPVVETPELDRMAERSVRFTNFYVSPVCSPTRSSLMTGRYNYRTRSVDTYIGRSMMDPDEITIAEILKQNGYRTGIFGKWHLGDCYPMRPMDQGFDVSVTHRGGGLCQPSDPLENRNRYTDPILFRNGEAFQATGFCTDVYFDNALRFIEESQQNSEPFFAYIATNAPHDPLHDVPAELKQQYLAKSDQLLELVVGEISNREQVADRLASVMAMITNIDQNIGRLLHRLKELQLTDNTLVVFLTDNGPASMRYVGKLRGMKSGVHEGGVRSPLWLHWPERLGPSRNIDLLSAHIDLMPTIVEVCGGTLPGDRKIDGRSLLPAINDASISWPDRWLVMQSHRGNVPEAFHHFMIRQGDWKLLHPSGFGREHAGPDRKLELYNLQEDPGEANNLAKTEPERVAQLSKIYADWFEDVSHTRPDNFAPPRIVIGSEFEKVTTLNRNEWRAANWNDQTIGKWLVTVANGGNYKVRVQFRDAKSGVAVKLSLGDREAAMEPKPNAHESEFVVSLATGDIEIKAWRESTEQKNSTEGAYQVFVSRVEND